MRLLHLVLGLSPIIISLYMYFKLRAAVGPGLLWTLSYFLLAAFLIWGSSFLWTADLEAIPRARRVLSYVVYMGIAFFFLMFTAFLALDLVRLAVFVLDLILSTRFAVILPSPRTRAVLATLFALAACSYGWMEALSVRPVYVTIGTDKLVRGVDRLRIAHITDVHLGCIVQEERLERILRVVRDAAPDMLVCTGDLVDGNMERREAEISLFREMDLPFGMLAVTGNHEYHAGVDQAVDFMRRAGMRVLRNEAVLAGGIVVAGVDDSSAVRYGERPEPEASVLRPLPSNRFVLLLKHQPVVDRDSQGLFDLQLSGHTHRGQIWPFYWATRAAYDYRPGLRALSEPHGGEAHASGEAREGLVIVSNGAGTWGPPIRFLAPPEVVIVDLVRR
ncbi:MAG: metallophosphoesterase [Synergistaceae bacterium]|nr:metallophosphoesterase [Synergistota bacterium]NLM71594.1 metallophosphoesterase [Synergistaceae bacterium]